MTNEKDTQTEINELKVEAFDIMREMDNLAARLEAMKGEVGKRVQKIQELEATLQK